MNTALRDCPLDHAMLISLAGQWSPSLGWQLYYCPKCDTPVLVIASGADSTSVTCWKRVPEGGFEPRSEGVVPSNHVATMGQLREQVGSYVSRWIHARPTEPSTCQMDGSSIQRLASLTHAGQHRAIYLWCRWCKLGFAFLNDPDYGWEPHISFARGPAGYELFKEHPVGGRVAYRLEWLQELTAPPPDGG